MTIDDHYFGKIYMCLHAERQIETEKNIDESDLLFSFQ